MHEEKKEKLSDKRWLLKNVLLPVLLACIPGYFGWLAAKATAPDPRVEKDRCELERAAHELIVNALVEQLKMLALEGAGSPNPLDPDLDLPFSDEPDEPDEPPLPGDEPTSDISPTAVSLSRSIANRFKGESLSDEEAGGQVQEVFDRFDARQQDLPPGFRREFYDRVQEQVQMQED